MSIVNAVPLLEAAGGDYTISRSVRLRSSASAYFSRTPKTPTNSANFTLSTWIKFGQMGVGGVLLYCGYNRGGGQPGSDFGFTSTGQLIIDNSLGSGNYNSWTSTPVFRDPSAWYHVVFNQTGATVNVYINGVLVWNLSTTASNYFNGAWPLQVLGAGGIDVALASFLDRYQAETHFIDGQVLTPSSFGETDAVTGVWKPKKYTGTYGANGFYLNFADNSAATAAAIGKDSSGNGNNWTPNNISVTAGATYDSMLDVPTPYADGGNGRGNYAVLNPLYPSGGNSANPGSWFVRSGNLDIYYAASGGWGCGGSAWVMSSGSGKWYWECTPINTAGPDAIVGVHRVLTTANFPYQILGTTSDVDGYGYHAADGQKYNNGGTAYGASYANGDVIGIALDMSSAGSASVTFYKNGVSQGVAYSGLSGDFIAAFSLTSGNTCSANFGQRPFSYTPPTGFKALNTQNLPDSTIKAGNKYFDATTYTGNGGTQSIVNAGGFQPDFVWAKNRASITDHQLYDSVRGVSNALFSNTTGAETVVGTGLSAFNSNGFTVGASSINTNGNSIVGWQWKGGGTAVSNTAGSIASQVSAGTTQGFSVVTYSTPASGAYTVGHGLGVAPSMFMIKTRNAVGDWVVYHKSIGASNNLILNTTAAQNAGGAGFWNSLAPTSSVLNLGSSVTGAYTIVAYCWAEVAGYSKFGSYTGNGSADGPFVYCGFRPRFVMIKRTDVADNWQFIDTSRNTYNAANSVLFPNLSNAESSIVNYNEDIVSNGFKIRNTDSSNNTNGATYIFAAFAENPFKNSLAR